MTTETWRVECEGGAVHEARVWRVVHGFDDQRIAVEIVADDRTTTAEFHGDNTRRCVVAWCAGLAGLPVVAILAPGQSTRAKVERDRAHFAEECARLRALLSPAAIVSRPPCRTCLRAWDVCVCEEVAT